MSKKKDESTDDVFREEYYEEESSSVGPSSSDADAWAARERRRRESWLAGPSEDEKRDWARREREQRRSRSDYRSESTLGPTDEEVDAWAARERRRRESWLAGPSEDEKIEWARRRRRTRRRPAEYADDANCAPSNPVFYDPTRDPVVRRLQRDTELATKGILNYCFNAPYIFMSQLIRAGRNLEEDPYFRSTTERVPFYED
jgi:hypothetical protein